MWIIRRSASLIAVLLAGVFMRTPQMFLKPNFLIIKSVVNYSLKSIGPLSNFLTTRTGTGVLQKVNLSSSASVQEKFGVVSSGMGSGGIPGAVKAPYVKLLSQNEAIQVDQELFNEYKFSVDQLMEMAGLSVATAVAYVYQSKKAQKILIVTGPGNNGGDGLVVARHLKIFGFENVIILNTRKPSKELYINLLHQAAENDVEISYDAESYRQDSSVGLIVDALFGFSFKPPVRPDFQPFLDVIVSASSKSIPVVAVDIPSGWDVENGPPEDKSISYMPEMLVSLTAPKECATYFEGPYHFIGGRFVPRKLALKYSLNLPDYPGTDCVVRIK